jgi:hypothetical protein
VSLQNNLDTLQQWEKDWLMSFNPDKCEVIRITNKKKIIDAKYTIHGQVLHGGIVCLLSHDVNMTVP